MKIENCYHNCSNQYIDSISPSLCKEISEVIAQLKKRETASEINADFFDLFTERNWSFDRVPPGHDRSIRKYNVRNLCLTSTTLETKWNCDFAKEFKRKLVQIGIQFCKRRSHVQRLLRIQNCLA